MAYGDFTKQIYMRVVGIIYLKHTGKTQNTSTIHLAIHEDSNPAWLSYSPT
jgi:hypothetical protein